MTDEHRPVTAEDLVRAINRGSAPVMGMAKKMGWQEFPGPWLYTELSAVRFIADILASTLPEQEQAAEVS